MVELEALRGVGGGERQWSVVPAQLGEGGTRLGDGRGEGRQVRVADRPAEEGRGDRGGGAVVGAARRGRARA